LTEQTPKIVSLNPVVLPDNRRVMFELVVKGLPNIFSNVDFMMPDFTPPAPSPPPKPAPDAPSPYPNVELSILNQDKQPVAGLFIVEHKEEYTSLTLHLRAVPDITQEYTARAEMTHQGQTIDMVEIPFRLNQVN